MAEWFLILVLHWTTAHGPFSRFVVHYASEAQCVKHLEAMRLHNPTADNPWVVAAWCQPYPDLRRPAEHLQHKGAL